MSFWRRRRRRNERGLSEIVGTLMLIIIVVAAATLLAAFVATYEKTLTTQENYAHEQSLESIHILALNTTLNSTGTGFATLGFTLASASVNPSTIIGIFLNSEPLSCFSWTNLDNGSKGQFSLSTANPNVGLSPFEELYVSTSLNPTAPCYSFSLTSVNPTPDHFIDLSVYTDLQNDFARSFLPPVPLAVVSELNPSGNNPLTLLDGTQSFQPGGNVSIVNWVWMVSGGGDLVSTATTLPSDFTQGTTSVPNGDLSSGSLLGTGATANFTVPVGFTFGSAEALGFTLSNNLTVSGTGSCVLTDSAISPGATGVVTGSVLTVTFSFTTVISSGCTGATLSLAGGGVTMTAVPVSASGEEYEISPALPYFGLSQAPFVVTLAVTNSVGLDGTLVEQYLPPA